MRSDVPSWVRESLNDKIRRGAFQYDGYWYVFTVERETCNRFECIIDVWQGRIPADDYDRTYNGEINPMEQKPDLTWADLELYQL